MWDSIACSASVALFTSVGHGIQSIDETAVPSAAFVVKVDIHANSSGALELLCVVLSQHPLVTSVYGQNHGYVANACVFDNFINVTGFEELCEVVLPSNHFLE